MNTATESKESKTIHIRKGEEKDIPRMLELLLQVCTVHHKGRPDLFRAGARKYEAEDLAKMLADPRLPILVAADENDRLCGYAFCVLQEHKGNAALCDIKTLYIDDLCVDEAMRGQHIGSALYRATVELAKSIGCHNLTLNAWSCNESAVRFYEAMGLKVQKYGMETIL